MLAFLKKNKDMKDRKRQDMQDRDLPLYQKLKETILGCCFDKRRLEYKRVHHPDHHAACDPAHLVSPYTQQ
jgi:hypothetical protein